MSKFCLGIPRRSMCGPSTWNMSRGKMWQLHLYQNEVVFESCLFWNWPIHLQRGCQLWTRSNSVCMYFTKFLGLSLPSSYRVTQVNFSLFHFSPDKRPHIKAGYCVTFIFLKFWFFFLWPPKAKNKLGSWCQKQDLLCVRSISTYTLGKGFMTLTIKVSIYRDLARAEVHLAQKTCKNSFLAKNPSKIV